MLLHRKLGRVAPFSKSQQLLKDAQIEPLPPAQKFSEQHAHIHIVRTKEQSEN